MGFYIRKGFNFGPLRLNLSRSGLGASFGVKGARIGIGPRGSYIHMGRGGLYYRQPLHLGQESPATLPSQYHPSVPQQPAIIDGLQEISSASAIEMVDSSAEQLLQELNRVKRRRDLFPIIVLAGIAMFVHLAVLSLQWWVYVVALLAVVCLAILARHNDVTNGTAILNYSFGGDSSKGFAELRNAFARLAGCGGVWHVEAAGQTTDWKRNAGVSTLERRTNNCPTISRPPRVECNVDVPSLSTGRTHLYFFPDRLLVYDSSGVGAVSYTDLNVQAGETRFVEDESVPSDAQQVGTTWRFVARSGGPDRRFNNNRQLPILLYGQLSLTSASGLNELFQCSVPAIAAGCATAVGGFRAAHPTATYNADENADASSAKGKGLAVKALLWAGLGLMSILFFFLPWPSLNLNSADDQRKQQEALARQEQARREFVESLNQRFIRKHMNVTASLASSTLTVQLTKEGPKTARRDGVAPFVKDLFLTRVLQPDTESKLCNLGFRTLSVSKNGGVPSTVTLVCATTPEKP
jgi:hypothetical protein